MQACSSLTVSCSLLWNYNYIDLCGLYLFCRFSLNVKLRPKSVLKSWIHHSLALFLLMMFHLKLRRECWGFNVMSAARAISMGTIEVIVDVLLTYILT